MKQPKAKPTTHNAIVRDVGYQRGAVFFDDVDEKTGKTRVMFKFTSDASSVFGPKVANDDEKREHAEAWRVYQVAKSGETKADPIT